MALIVVNLTDTFNDWREKTNSSIAQIGDLSALATANSASIVGALNGMMENVIDDLTPQLGGPLDVNDKAIVSAVGTNKNITITGSNGKTTTTSLIYHILKSSGKNVGVAGNIGNSFAFLVAMFS